MGRVHLLCHGPTTATRRVAFPANEPLDAAGVRTVVRARTQLRPARHYLTSPELRARQTAEALDLNAEVTDELRECDYGAWAGRSFNEVLGTDPEGLSEWLRDPQAIPHGGESLAAVRDRVADWLRSQERQSGPTLLVTHATIIRSAITLALGAPPASFWRIDIAPLACATLKGRDGRWTLESLASSRRGDLLRTKPSS